MAGLPAKNALVRLPVLIRSLPENETPPAMRVDIY